MSSDAIFGLVCFLIFIGTCIRAIYLAQYMVNYDEETKHWHDYQCDWRDRGTSHWTCSICKKSYYHEDGDW